MEKLKSSFIVILLFLGVILILLFAMHFELGYVIAESSLPTPSASIEHSTNSATYNANTYYSWISYALTGADLDNDEYYAYSIDDGISWVDHKESVLIIDSTTNKPSISFKIKNSETESNVVKYNTPVRVDASPSINFIETPAGFYTQTPYQINFTYSTYYVPFVTTVQLLPYGAVDTLGAYAGGFVASENGIYRVSTTSETGASTYSDVLVDRIDNAVPEFFVLPQTGGNNGIWGAKATYVIIPKVFPISAVRYQYSFDNYTWTTSLTDENSIYVIDVVPDINKTIYFRAVSGSGVIYDFVPADEDVLKFTTCVDSQKPVVTVDVISSSTVPSNQPVVLDVSSTTGVSGVTVYFSTELTTSQEIKGNQLTIYLPGIYRFYSVSGAGIASDEVIMDFNYIDIIAPEIKGVTAGEIYKTNVSIAITEAATVTVKINNKEETVTLDSFGNVTFTKSGNYVLTAIDVAGNQTQIVFNIEKPNVALITVLCIIFAGVILAFAFLIVFNIKKSEAIKRLVSKTTATDDDNKFLMFKRIRKDKGGNKQ
ncbi:MAG: hypothetical protein LBF68_01715 [Christensenellaceae bacterium]|jgi:hypothetical protein|nr:hypothetical protein [Christensenellaceae bacterium]